jgi:ATP-dependent helicase/nuclease subunit A
MSSSILDSYDLTTIQRQAVYARGRDVCLTAGAGSGKTRTLTARYLSLLEEGLAPRSVVAVTFTEKAAREMRNRIRATINGWVGSGLSPADRARWAVIEADIDTARIGTIHSLCAEIIRAHPVEAAVDPGFEVVDEGLAAAWRAQAAEDALAWASGEVTLVALLRALSPMQLRAGLSRLLGFRLDAVAAFSEEDLLARWPAALQERLSAFVSGGEVEGAITELTRLSASRMLEEDAGPKLADQVERLLSEWRQMRLDLGDLKPGEAVARLALIRETCLNLQLGKKDGQAKPQVRLLREAYASQVEGWLGRPKDTQSLTAMEEVLKSILPGLRALFLKASEFYEHLKAQNHSLDFDDLEDRASRLLRLDAVRGRWSAEVASVLVDEFQDTNARQRGIVEALAGLRDGQHSRLFVVGDAKQSIYRFRGADVTVFVDVEREVQAGGGLVLHLARTFRAHPPLLEVFNDLMPRMMAPPHDARPFDVTYEPLEASRTGPRADVQPPFLEVIIASAGDAARARSVAAATLAQRLVELHDAGARWDDIALLFRASPSFPDFEQALEDAGVPFVTVAGGGFYDRPEIRDLLNLLRAIASPRDDLAMAGLLRSPAFGLSDAGLFRLRWPASGGGPVGYQQALGGDLTALTQEDRECAGRARTVLELVGALANRVAVAELLKDVLDRTLYLAVLRAAPGGERLYRNVEKLLQDAHDSGIVRVEDFLEYVETLKSVGAREGEAPSEALGAVRLMTVHKAKGLEFPIVVLADASRQAPGEFGRVLLSPELGVVARPGRRTDEEPIAFRLARAVEREHEQAEERRLLYVGATRAQEKLIVVGYRGPRRGESWLSLLEQALDEAGARPAAGGPPECLMLPANGALVAVREVHISPPPAALRRAAGLRPPDESERRPLFRLVPDEEVEDTDDKPQPTEDGRGRRQNIFAVRAENDAKLIGRLVHVAILRWCFPGDARLQPLLRASARNEGMLDELEAEQHIAQVVELLGRLRQDARWTELDGARRFQEVPYSLRQGTGTTSGRIDLLVKRGDSVWQIIDFKTSAIHGADNLEAQSRSEFGPQLARYRHAVQEQLGAQVETWVCLLNYEGHIEWRRGP